VLQTRFGSGFLPLASELESDSKKLESEHLCRFPKSSYDSNTSAAFPNTSAAFPKALMTHLCRFPKSSYDSTPPPLWGSLSSSSTMVVKWRH